MRGNERRRHARVHSCQHGHLDGLLEHVHARARARKPLARTRQRSKVAQCEEAARDDKLALAQRQPSRGALRHIFN